MEAHKDSKHIYIIYYSLKNKKKQPKQLMNGRKINKIF